MILLDTHIWVWLVEKSDRLTPVHRRSIEANRDAGLGVSAISCWEVATLVRLNRLEFTVSVDGWTDAALAYRGIQLIDLSPRIAIESTRLPGIFHRDPADQIIVATARDLDCVLLTVDERILAYPHVKTLSPHDNT